LDHRMAGLRLMLAFANHPRGRQGDRDRASLPIRMRVCYFGRGGCFCNYAIQVVRKISTNGGNAHRSTVPARSLTIEDTARSGLPRHAFADGPKDAVCSPAVAALRFTGVFSGKSVSQSFPLNVAIALQTSDNG